MKAYKILIMALIAFTILGTTCAGGSQFIQIQNKTLKDVIIDSLINDENQINIAFNDTIKRLSEGAIFLKIDKSELLRIRKSDFFLFYHYINEESKVIKARPKRWHNNFVRIKVIFRD